MLDHFVHEDDTIGAGREDESAADGSLERINFTLVRHRLSIPELRIFTQKPRRHPMNNETSAIGADNEVLNQLLRGDNFDDVIETERAPAIQLIIDMHALQLVVLIKDA